MVAALRSFAPLIGWVVANIVAAAWLVSTGAAGGPSVAPAPWWSGYALVPVGTALVLALRDAVRGRMKPASLETTWHRRYKARTPGLLLLFALVTILTVAAGSYHRAAAFCSERACRQSGDCDVVVAGESIWRVIAPFRCQPGSDDHCRASSECVQQGACAAIDGVCAPRTRDDCQKSTDCTAHGACFKVGELCAAPHLICQPGRLAGTCLEVDDPADCAAAGLCARLGLCSVRDGMCVPSTAEEQLE